MATAIHQYEDKLLNFAYGELPAPEASAVESHLKSCVRCTQALSQIRDVRTTMSALPQEPAPTAGLESLLAYAEQAAARNAAAPRPGQPWWRRMIAPLAGACALGLVAIVAIKTQEEGLDLSAEKAALDATPRTEVAKAEMAEMAEPPVPIVAAAPAADIVEGDSAPAEKVVQRMKAGKVAGGLRSAEAERNAKTRPKAPAKNDYQQALGETKGPADEEAQLAQRKDLGDALGAAQKESKSRREAPAMDYGNARGGYQGKQYEESKKAEERTQQDKAEAPMGISTASKPSSPKPSAAPSPQPPPSAQVAAKEPAENSKAPSSLSMGLGTGSTSAGRPSTGGGGFKKGSRDTSDDETAGRGANEIADRKRLSDDVEADQRVRELEARRYLDAARSASNQNNHQEAAKQSLSVLATNVTGASRAEALNRLCLAFDELGDEAQSDKYCNALIREFPNTTAARQLVVRRKKLENKSPAPARSYDEAADKKAEPAKAKASDAPAQAY